MDIIDIENKYIENSLKENHNNNNNYKEFSYEYNTNTNSNTKVLFFEDHNNNENKENYLSELESIKSKIVLLLKEKENSTETKKEKENSTENHLLNSLIKNSILKTEKIKTVLITEKKLAIKFQDYITFLENYFNLKIFFYYLEEGDFFKQNYDSNKILEFCLENNLQKKSIIIGLGGGKITDIAGYIAGNYFRGISCLLIPTNLLAMVDASVGGKNGINSLKYGKNVIGTIIQPKM
jgi:hypothetical protein